MLEKKYTEMDYVLMQLQKMGNDQFRLGFSFTRDTVKEAIEEAIKNLQEYLEEHKDDEPEEAPYGYYLNFEFFKKGKPKRTF